MHPTLQLSWTPPHPLVCTTHTHIQLIVTFQKLGMQSEKYLTLTPEQIIKAQSSNGGLEERKSPNSHLDIQLSSTQIIAPFPETV